MVSGKSRGQKLLTVKAIEAWLRASGFKPGQKLADGGGLYLTRLPGGGATWQARYSAGSGRALKTYSIGPWPRVALEAARRARDQMREQLHDGKDPNIERKLSKVLRGEADTRTFRSVADDWLDKQATHWSDVHYTKSSRAFERDVYPRLGDLPIDRIDTRHVASVIDAIQRRGGGRRETALRVLQHVRSVFRFAQAKGWRPDNPAEPVIELIEQAPETRHHPALLTFPELGEVLRRAEAANISPSVRLAHRLIAFTAVRIANAVEARWAHFELDAEVPTWTIPRSEMKVSGGRAHAHTVVLPMQIVSELKRWRALQPKNAQYLFPGNQGRAFIGREAVEKALRVTLRLAGKHSPHGWRAAFSTRAREDTDYDKELVDLCLDHVHASETARAYDRGERRIKRVELMKWWGDSLDRAERAVVDAPEQSSQAA